MRLSRIAATVVFVALVAGCGGGEGEEPGSSSATATTASTAAAGGGTLRAEDDEAAAREAFGTYTRAALARDGAGAVSVMASPVFAFYEQARQLALTATEDELSRQSVVQRLNVYILRGEIDAAALREDSPQELVTTAIDQGLVGEQGIRDLELGEVRVDGDEATGQLLVRGQVTPVQARFLREGGEWRFDISPLIAAGEDGFETAAEEQGLSVDEFVAAFLESTYGAERAAQLRNPPSR